MARIYFDNAATAPLDPRVRAALEPHLSTGCGNPSSMHAGGRAARAAVEHARTQVAALVGAPADNVVFTSGGTEADNLALLGAWGGPPGSNGHVVTSTIEHPAVLEGCRHLERRGVRVSYAAVDADGRVDPAAVRRLVQPDTRLVSVMAANNVIGTLQPLRALAAVAHEHGALFHTDAVQAAGTVPIDIERDGIDLLSLSGHKLHGPAGSGALVVRRGVALEPVLVGGGQEHGRRSGTENVAAIVGLGAAAELCRLERADEAARLVTLRERLITGVQATIPETYVIGDRWRRLPGNACLGFAGCEGESIKLLLALDEAGISVSAGSACSAHRASEPSYILRALGYDPLRARGALRITLGRFNTADEVDRFLEILPPIVRGLVPVTSRARAATGVRG